MRLLAACHGAVRPGALARRPAVVFDPRVTGYGRVPRRLVVVKENTAPPKKCREGRGNYMLDAENAAVLRTHAHHMHGPLPASWVPCGQVHPTGRLPERHLPRARHVLARATSERHVTGEAGQDRTKRAHSARKLRDRVIIPLRVCSVSD